MEPAVARGTAGPYMEVPLQPSSKAGKRRPILHHGLAGFFYSPFGIVLALLRKVRLEAEEFLAGMASVDTHFDGHGCGLLKIYVFY